MNINKDICIRRFSVIFNGAHFSYFKVDQTFTVQNLEHEHSDQLEFLSYLVCMVHEFQALIFLYF
jgi:hypothetical protein